MSDMVFPPTGTSAIPAMASSRLHRRRPRPRRRRRTVAAVAASSLLLPPLLLLLLVVGPPATRIDVVTFVRANPKSRPYVAYRTSPFDQDVGGGNVPLRIMEDGAETGGGGVGVVGPPKKNEVNRRPRGGGEDPRCPLSFRLGSCHGAHFGAPPMSSSGYDGDTTASSSSHSSSSDRSGGGGGGGRSGGGAHAPPVIHPLHPDYDAGSGRQILLTADWEMLEMWTPGSAVGARDYRPGGGVGEGGGGGVEGRSSAEQLKEDEQFPLLFEGSSFYHASPIVHDVGGDGVADAILGDYDGNVHVVGLDFEPSGGGGGGGGGGARRTRAYRRIAIPRLYVRKSWYEVAINRTREDLAMAVMAVDADANATADGNRTKKWEEFEPYHTYFASSSGDEKWRGKADEDALRGVSGNVLNMDVDSARGLAERRRVGGVSGSSRGGGRKDGGGEEVGGGGATTGGGGDGDGDVDVEGGGAHHRRLQEEVVGNVDADREDEQHEVGGGEVDADREKREGGGDPATADADGDIREGVGNEEADANRNEHDGVGSDVETGGEVGGARDASDEGVERNDAGAGTGEVPKRYLDDYMSSEEGLFGDEGLFDDAMGAPPDGADSAEEYAGNLGDDAYLEHEAKGDIVDSTEVGRATDDFYGDRGVDDYYGRRSGYKPETPEGWDSYEQWQAAKNEYYHDSNYIRLPPHLLSTCSLVELQRSYGSSSAKPEDKIDELVLCAVSYYFDEDECRDPSKGHGKSFGKHANADGGDETEELRGRYMASAVMAYNLK